MKIEIKDRSSGSVLFSLETSSLKLAVETAVKRGVSLRGSDLRGCDLRGCELRGSDLSGSDLRGCDLRDSDLRESDLSDSDLSGSDLSRSDLRRSDLRGCDLGTAKNVRLPTGETWKEYLTKTVPALLTAGGHKLEEIANFEHWNCHSWENCPMAAAFKVKRLEDIPILLRPRAEQFIQLFDAGQIKLESILPRAV